MEAQMDYGALTHPVVDRRDKRRSWKKAALLLVALGAVACVVAVATTPEVKPLQGVSAVTNVEATPQWGVDWGAIKRKAEEHARNIARAAEEAARRAREHAARVAEEARRAAEAVRRKAEEAARAAKELLQRKERERKDRIQRNHGNFCADEHRTCHCTGTVKFGGDFDTSRNPLFGGGKWTSKGVGGAISCTVRAFGRDPAIFLKKKCYCRPGPAPTPAPTTPAPTSMPTYHPTPPPPTPQPTRPHYDGGGSKMGIVNPVFDF